MAGKGELVAPSPPAEDLDDDGDFTLTTEFMDFELAVKQEACKEWGLQPGACWIDSPLHVIFAAVHANYGNRLDTLQQRATNVGENARLSQALTEACANKNWQTATVRKYTGIIKRILDMLSFPEGFVASLKIACRQSAQGNKALGKYGSLPAENPIRKRLDGWVEMIRNDTRNQSDLSIRNIISFYFTACLPALGLDLKNWPDDPIAHVASHVKDNPNAVKSIVGEDASAQVKAGRLEFLLHNIIGSDIDVPKPGKFRSAAPTEDDDGSDIHRISATDLELLYTEAKKDTRDELFFMLMLTTGLRVGGVCNILTRHVADIRNNQYVVRKEGKTKEKGNKFASFVMCTRVRELVSTWLARLRPADTGPYLFPGTAQGSHISTDATRLSFARLCHKCGLKGPQFHPHALRHTNAHMLLECGNSVEAVSKCLNHSSTAVTEKFYLRESAAEVQSRCIVPWAPAETETEKRKRGMDALPGFLKASNEVAKDATENEDRKRRRLQRKAILRDFTTGASSSNSGPS
jgi:hypothetical protein